MFLIGVADFLYQWWEHERQLMMSKQEIKDEYKQLEGDPHIKAHRDSLRRQRARERMMSAVKDADVVVRNPEHFAVALKYDIEKNQAPIVVAKGKDFMALQIIKEAVKHGVISVENPQLARALYASVAIDTEVPQQFWSVVVEIIAHIMLLRGQDLTKLSSDIEKVSKQRRTLQAPNQRAVSKPTDFAGR
jgi:flagellar biosynthetic protein FlhB